jgi:hypothetical protein
MTLTNLDNTINGFGNLGGGALTLVNDSSGVISATDPSSQLKLDTGSGTFTNRGTVDSSGLGGLEIVGDVVNGGTLEAKQGTLKLDGHVSAAVETIDTLLIDGGTVEFGGAASTSDAIVQFNHPVTLPGVADTLVVDKGGKFGGSVSGFANGGVIDLAGVASSAISFSSDANGLSLNYGSGSGPIFSFGARLRPNLSRRM